MFNSEIECLFPKLSDKRINFKDDEGNVLDDGVTYVYNDVIVFNCDAGYRLIGSENAICSRDEMFIFINDEKPRCEGLFKFVYIFC